MSGYNDRDMRPGWKIAEDNHEDSFIEEIVCSKCDQALGGLYRNVWGDSYIELDNGYKDAVHIIDNEYECKECNDTAEIGGVDNV